MVAYTFYDGDNRVMRYAETLARRGDEVDVIALRRAGDAHEAVLNGVRVLRVQERAINESGWFSYATRILRFMVRATWRVARQHMRRRYDVVHVHSVPDFLVFSALVPRLSGARVLLDIHDILPEFYASKFRVSPQSLSFRLLVWVEKLSAAFAHHVIIANHLWHERLTSRSVPARKCTAILNAPDRTIFSPQPRTRQDGRFLLIYPGTLNVHQGLDVAVQAMSIVATRLPQAELHVYGEGPSKPGLIQMAGELGLAERVRFYPPRPLREIVSLISEADLGVVPKRSDGFGNEAFSTKILEFMALGVPVVAAETRIDRYYFDDKVIRFFRNGDAEDLAAAILDLAGDAGLRRRQAEKASQYVSRNDWETYRQTYLDIVEGGKAAPPSLPAKRPAAAAVAAASAGPSNNGTPGGPPDAFLSYFRCPEDAVVFHVAAGASSRSGFFRFGDAVCFGATAGGEPAPEPAGELFDAAGAVQLSAGSVRLPFDPTAVVENLRREHYTGAAQEHRLARSIYYTVRPLLGRRVRSFLQRVFFRGWQHISFPSWPVDCTVDSIFEKLMALAIQARGGREVPFIWFWPQGHSAALMMTHDIEGPLGASFCPALMQMDDSYGIKSSFQVVPEQPHGKSEFINALRTRGFEVNLHDLHHDGRLFSGRQRFEEHVRRVNEYAQMYGTRGFRAGAMYRNQDWFGALDFAYDMSVPSSAHLEPQRGGCCTVMPYAVGHILELPLTTTQDYTLFYILGEYGTDRWKQQIETILARHGLISFIVHPDYLLEERALQVYGDLLRHIAELRTHRGVWVALPADINHWWRQRSEMKLVREGSAWRIEGPGQERACVAYASLQEGRLTYRVAGDREGTERSLGARRGGSRPQ